MIIGAVIWLPLGPDKPDIQLTGMVYSYIYMYVYMYIYMCMHTYILYITTSYTTCFLLLI